MMESNKRFPLKDKACSVGAPILAPQRHILSISSALYNSLCCSHWWRQVLEATILFLTSGLYVFSRYNIANVPMWQCNECCRDGGCCQCCTIIRAQAAVNIGARLKWIEVRCDRMNGIAWCVMVTSLITRPCLHAVDVMSTGWRYLANYNNNTPPRNILQK